MSTALRPWTTGFGFMEPFRREMENMMEKFLGSETGNGKFAVAKPWSPRVDVEETDKEILVKAELPGVDPKAVEITFHDGVLTIRGEQKEEKEEKKKSYHCIERFTGSFYRAIALPAGTDAEKLSATSSNGVITVTIPKKPEAQSKKISVTPKG